jgi:hypothetical protein
MISIDAGLAGPVRIAGQSLPLKTILHLGSAPVMNGTLLANRTG